MDFSLIAYILLCIVLGITLFRTLSNSGRFWGALIILVLSILIFVFYGMRWFAGDRSKFRYNGPWPPVINMCPDYLIYFKNGSTDTCIDMLGVSRGMGTLKPWTREDNPNNPPQDPQKYFAFVYKPGMNTAEMKNLCNATMQAGLTWEGITNGDSCTISE
jgi:hypothetical protein